MFNLVTPEIVGLSSARLERVSAWMRHQVERQRLPGLSVLIHRRGENAFFATAGMRDIEAGEPVSAETLFRIYSMTKPITSVAAMMLFEEGRFLLDDPIARFIPEFADLQVLVGGDAAAPVLEPARDLITVRHLFTHTSGLTYAAMMASPVDALYRQHKINFAAGRPSLAEMTARTARMPLLCHPGSAWNYGVSSDVLGRLVEVWSGQPLDRFFAERIFAPLGMTDTAFQVAEEKLPRLAALYGIPGGNGLPFGGPRSKAGELTPEPGAGLQLLESPAASRLARPTELFSGGGGLVSTTSDYLRFCRMLLNRGELDGVRLLGRKTVEYMTTNHLPGDMASMGSPRFAESPCEGIGFGLGFSVVLDPVRAQTLSSVGEFAWGGAASTAFWIDPREEMIVILMTQLMPSSAYPLRRELRSLVNQALIG